MGNFLEFVRNLEHPSRYIGLESNRAVKDLSKIKLRVCLVFPDLYEIGSSHLGFELVYWLFNEHPQVYCERAFMPAPDAISELRANNLKLFSLETKTPLDQFDVIGISLLYSLHFTSVLEILDLSGIPVRSENRKGLPLVIAGGIECINPFPMADFIDVFAIGDGEILVPKIVEVLLSAKKRAMQREEILEKLADSEFFYVPHLADNGAQKLHVKRAIISDLEITPYPTSSLVPLSLVAHDRLILEIARGCFRNCRFCQAGYFYRPFREKSLDKLLGIARNLIRKTGYDEVSLLSLSAGDHSQIESIIKTLSDSFSHIPVAVSLPSLQVKTLNSKIASSIARVRKTGFTIAPEAGTERLRNVINKPISNSEVIESVRSIFEQGWSLVKLYFMIGLPTETEDDRDAILDVVSSLAEIGVGRRRIGVNVNIGTFVPKPHTAFQWSKQLDLSESQRIIDKFKSLFSRRVQLKWHEPKMSYVEGVLSRGDRSVCRLIERAWRFGAVLDSWGDHFNFEAWEKALDSEGIDVRKIFAEKPFSERFAWEVIDIGVKREYLESEWRISKNADLTPTCKESCTDCGVCADEIKLKFAESEKIVPVKIARGSCNLNLRYRLKLSKLGLASILSHHEIYKILSRALLRAGLYPAYSKGFHPKPKFSFGLPTKVGVESEEEFVDVWLKDFIRPRRFKERLQKELPEGLCILDVKVVPEDAPTLASSLVGARYKVILSMDSDQIRKAIEDARLKISVSSLVREIRYCEDSAVELEIVGPLVSLPPFEKIVADIFEMDEAALKNMRIKKLKTYLGAKGEKNGRASDKRDA